MGIRIGKRVVKVDLYLTRRRGRPADDGSLMLRENRITVSAGDDNWDCLARHMGDGEKGGFFDSLTDAQKAAALAYRGPENHGDARYRLAS
jgi:hypothetical protein